MPKKSASAVIVIVRATQAGCHIGELVAHDGKEVTLRNARRIWYWRGAQTLDELAVYGSSKIGDCKIAPPVERKEILDACEIIYCQPAGASNLMGAAEWRA